ncbi:MAG: hypothetical protein ABFR33_08905 [Verrucomicrobiota bacterium]
MNAKMYCFAMLILFRLFLGSAVASATVSYSDFTESSGTDATPLFQTPTVSGDTLNFDPVFTAYADGSGGNASDTTDGHLGFDVYVIGNHIINELRFSERGDYSLLSFGNAALVDVSATLFVEVLEVDGAALASPVNGEAEMSFSPNANGQFLLTSFGTTSGLWTGSADFDIDTLLASHGVPFDNGATKVHVELGNTLQALAQIDSQAFIGKNDLQVFSVTSEAGSIPEPASLGLLIGIPVFLTFIRRRICN